MQQNIYVTQANTNRGCGSGCGTTLAVLLLVVLAVKYWYISAALAVAGVAVGIWYYRHRDAATANIPLGEAGIPISSPCASCGQLTAGNFCSHCGTAQTKVCSHCAMTGLTSPYCPECGAATYAPPAIT